MDDRILDATLARVVQVGVRRTSMNDIARRAGVSRVTIYRRFTSKEALVEAAMTREANRLLAELTTIQRTTAGVDAQIEESVLYVIRQSRDHPLISRWLAEAPEDVVPFYTIRGQSVLSLGIDYIADVLDAAQQRGAVDRYDPRPVAELLARLAHSLMLTPDASLDFADERTSRDFVQRILVPLVRHGTVTGLRTQ